MSISSSYQAWCPAHTIGVVNIVWNPDKYTDLNVVSWVIAITIDINFVMAMALKTQLSPSGYKRGDL
ncbi:hypothetical protein BT09F24_13330 [Escherichia coli]